MLMMLRNFFRHLTDSFKNLKRNGWMTFAAIIATTITLFVVGCFMLFVTNANHLAQEIQDNVTVSVFMDTNITKEQQKTLKNELQAIPNVKDVTYSSKQEQYKDLVKTMGKEWEVFSEDDNPLYDVYIVSAKDPRKTHAIQQKASTLAHVAQASYGGTNTEKLLTTMDSIKKWGIIVMIVVIIIAMFLISNTIRMTILSRKQEIQIMRLVGATNGYIRWPFFLEGAWIGLFGAIIPIGILSVGYPYVYSLLSPTLTQAHYTLLSAGHLLLPVSLLLIVFGMIIGSIGAMISMRRFLKV